METPNFASRDWLLGHLAENRREAARLAASPSPQFERHAKQIRQARTKPWPRRRGYATASGREAMWRL